MLAAVELWVAGFAALGSLLTPGGRRVRGEGPLVRRDMPSGIKLEVPWWT